MLTFHRALFSQILLGKHPKGRFSEFRNSALLRLALAHHTYLSRKQTRIKVFYHERSSIPRALSTRRERLPVPDVLSFSRKSERRVTPGKFRVLSRSFVSGVVSSATERDRGSHRGLLANRGTRGGRDWRVETDIFAAVETHARWVRRVEHENWWQCHQRVLGFSARIRSERGRDRRVRGRRNGRLLRSSDEAK